MSILLRYRPYRDRTSDYSIGVFLSKRLSTLIVVFISFAAVFPFAESQVPQIPNVRQEDLASHLMVYVVPSYPTKAQAAQVQGNVVIHVEVGVDGLVRSTEVVSGPAMLRQGAVSALKQWRYVPFHSGKETIAVTGDVLISFTLNDKPEVHTPHESSANGSYSVTVTFPTPDHTGEADGETANRFEVPWEACTRGVIAHSTDANTADACKRAATIADQFPKDSRFVEKRRAYVYAATAYANVRDLETALHYADKAVEVVKLGNDDNSGDESAYSVRGEVRALSGDMSGGDTDLSVAEDYARKGQLTGALKQDLQFHAELLKRMNRLEEAQAKLAEAADL
jgi:TonB family protein